MQTIVELPEFQRRAASLLSDSEKQAVISYLAAHPQSGAIMQGAAVFESFGGQLVAKEKAAVFALFTNSTMKRYCCSF